MLPEIEGTLLPGLPWGEISFDNVLDYYEQACITLQRGPDGQLYLTWWNNMDDAVERWVCLPLSKARLQAILSGEMPSRYAMDHPEDGYVLVVDIDLETDAVLRTVKTTTAALSQDSLPRPEASLTMPMPATL